MADRGDDRDGLKLDQLHVTLGPVLPDWPAGLVVRVTLQGDVVRQAAIDETFASAAGGGSYWTEPWRRALAGEPVTTAELARRRLAAHLDSLGRLLAVAGWDHAAVTGRRLRDETLAAAAPEVLRPAVGRFTRHVEHSRLLAWSTRGLRLLAADDTIAAGVGNPALRGAGDVTARYRRWCREVRELTATLDDLTLADPAVIEPPRGRLDDSEPPTAALLRLLPGLITGAELAAVRLIVASLDPDVDELPAPVAVAHGG
jgi:hypothetical protein